MNFWRRLVLGGYPVAITLIYVVLVALPAWVLLDACFDPALMWVRVDLGVPCETGTLLSEFPQAWDEAHRWDALGPRVGGIIASICLLAVCLAAALARVVLVRPRDWHVGAVFFAVLMVGAFVYQYENVLWMGVRHRVSGQLWRFEAAAAPLLESWPTQSGDLPEAGEYFTRAARPGTLYLKVTDYYSLTEDFGMFVERLPNGGVVFSLEPHYRFCIEYHPAGRKPAPQRRSKYSGDLLIKFAKLDDGWYLTQYSSAGK